MLAAEELLIYTCVPLHARNDWMTIKVESVVLIAGRPGRAKMLSVNQILAFLHCNLTMRMETHIIFGLYTFLATI